ncbi:DUF2268 domain-containing protein [Nisaea acidiphila]|uniref:DUF2268 domain-containing protein n=1 Tax=Nisaea acidiphila TaxID=1862145 RepID=A0A9J7AYA0_9PROT|nr:DUF2268 domain-containing protein [Nisaea acidiphila]UUX51401.1 DUF2268 domain-containing protein [Nisaea acidiphila]
MACKIIGNAWHIHYVNARGELEAVKGAFETALTDAHRRISEITEPPAVDFLVESVWTSSVIPERGHLGRANDSLVTFWLALDHPVFKDNLGEPLARSIAHEINHVMRFRAAGFSSTFGQLLVSEGLAGRFVEELYSNKPEPWEQALTRAELAGYVDSALDQFDASTVYRQSEIDVNEWMFGTGKLPRWLGYTLGYEMVGAYLRERPELRASDLLSIPSADFKPMLAGLAS